MASDERTFTLHAFPSVELICAPERCKRKGHDWGGKSQKKIRREIRQKGGKRYGK